MIYLITFLCLSALITAVISLLYSIKTTQYLNAAAELRRQEGPKDKKILVPGRGIFSPPPKKKAPKAWTEEELWVREQDER